MFFPITTVENDEEEDNLFPCFEESSPRISSTVKGKVLS